MSQVSLARHTFFSHFYFILNLIKNISRYSIIIHNMKNNNNIETKKYNEIELSSNKKIIKV